MASAREGFVGNLVTVKTGLFPIKTVDNDLGVKGSLGGEINNGNTLYGGMYQLIYVIRINLYTGGVEFLLFPVYLYRYGTSQNAAV